MRRKRYNQRKKKKKLTLQGGYILCLLSFPAAASSSAPVHLPAVLGAASLLGGCKSNGNDTVVEVKVGDTVRNWNGLGVQLTSVFHLTQDPVQPAGYEYLGVRVTTVNRSKTESYAIGAQGIDAINEAYPVPPLENVDANFQAMAAATPDFTAVCDGQPAACCANISLYNANSQSFSDVESLPPQGSAYIVLMLMVPKDWKQLKVTYVPTFLEGKSLTFVMNASDVIRS